VPQDSRGTSIVKVSAEIGEQKQAGIKSLGKKIYVREGLDAGRGRIKRE
jgi:hypothetical protein